MTVPNEKLQRLLDRNRDYAKTHNSPPRVEELPNLVPPSEMNHQVVVISCCDPRVFPGQFLKTQPFEATLVRNAGGRAMDAIRTILDLDGMVPIKTILVIHHTDCGMTHQSDAAVRNRCKAKAATPELAAELDNMEFGEITDMDESLKHDVALLKEKAGPYLAPELQIYGYRYDTFSGMLHAVA